MSKLSRVIRIRQSLWTISYGLLGICAMVGLREKVLDKFHGLLGSALIIFCALIITIMCAMPVLALWGVLNTKEQDEEHLD